MIRPKTCRHFIEDSKTAFFDIDTWLGTVRTVFCPEPFYLLRIYLPEIFTQNDDGSMPGSFSAKYPSPECRRRTDEFCGMIRDYFDNKKPIDTPWDRLCFKKLSVLQIRVLEITAAIPLSRVRSYGDIAAELGRPGAARFVGNVLAANPYPLIIPCHRVIRSNGSAGGFGGGSAMKLRLLEYEGVMKHTVLAHRK